MKSTNPGILSEAKRLHEIGLAILWLHKKGKEPIETGWTSGPRKEWAYLEKTYVDGYNVGVRLGEPSFFPGHGYLAVIDVDIKSEDPRHQEEVNEAVLELLGGVQAVEVASGRGNGSRHYYFCSDEPFKTFNPAQSDELVKYYRPHKKITKKEKEELTENELKEGLRLGRAWEISLYSRGRQTVLPPSVHPDTGNAYTWVNALTQAESLPLLNFNSAPALAKKVKARSNETTEFNFSIEPVDLGWLDISSEIRDAIENGTGITDRSGYLLTAATALVSAGLNQNEILSVLTDTKLFLGECARDHTKSENRNVNAAWVYKYTLKKIQGERNAKAAFADAPPPEMSRELSESEMQEQSDEFKSDQPGKGKMRKKNKKAPPAGIFNCLALLRDECGGALVGFNEFTLKETYLRNSLWKSRKGEDIRDIDIVRIKVHLDKKYSIEFKDDTILQGVAQIADENSFHPIVDWLKALKWDGVPRAETWLKDYAGVTEAPDLYLRGISRKFLVAMVTRVHRPGCKWDYVLILEGIQGIRKSTLLKTLAGPDYFTDQGLDFTSKDAVQTIEGKWIIEMSELSGLSKAHKENAKAFISRATDRIRKPYGRKSEDYPRQCVLTGSSNTLDGYLKDDTGNRRYWGVRCRGKIDIEGLEKIRDQLFAEAMHLYKQGETLYLNKEEEAEAFEQQTERLARDEWTSIIDDLLLENAFGETPFEMKDLANKMHHQNAHRLEMKDQQRIGACLRSLGYDSKRKRVGESWKNVWKKERD